jgi:hypothetical protein
VNTLHRLSYEGRALRFIKGPRFEGDLPWWIAADILSCIADLMDRPDLVDPLLRHLLEGCPAEDRTEVTMVENGQEMIIVAVSEFELQPMIVALGDSRRAPLVALNRWFWGAAREAASTISGNVNLACARRGIACAEAADADTVALSRAAPSGIE